MKQQVHGIAVNSCCWILEYGRVVVNPLVEGATPYEFKTQTRRSVEFHRVVDDPENIFKIMCEKREHKLFVRNVRQKYNALQAGSGGPERQLSTQRPQEYRGGQV